MTPKEICTEIVTRLQLGGGVSECQPLTSNEWMVRTCDLSVWFNGSDLNDVAEAIRALSDKPRWTIKYPGRVGAMIWHHPYEGDDWVGEGATEAEALTRALHAYLRANRIGEEHLQTREPEEPWIDVSESVSTANLPEHGRKCEINYDGDKLAGWEWDFIRTTWTNGKGEDERILKPKGVGGKIDDWRYEK